jgi:hypothetical protein
MLCVVPMKRAAAPVLLAAAICVSGACTAPLSVPTDAGPDAAIPADDGGSPETGSPEASTPDGAGPGEGGSTAPLQHFSLVVAGGNHQAGLPGAALPNALVVRAQDFHQAPVAGAAVTFAVAGGSGTLQCSTTTTDANGYARCALTLGAAAGVTTVTATSGAASASFTETAAAGLATTGVSLDDAAQGVTIHARFGTNFMGNYLDAVQVPNAPPQRKGSIPGLTRLQDWPSAVVRIHANPATNGPAENASLPLPYATTTAAAWDFSFLDQQILDAQSIQPGQDVLLCVAYAPYDWLDQGNTHTVGAGVPLVTFPRPTADPGDGYLTDPTYAAYATYIQNLVRYYDGTGFTDSYGTHVRPANLQPIRYWSISNEPNWAGTEWTNVGNPPSFTAPYPPQFAPEQFVTFWNATVPGMKSIAAAAGNPILLVGPEAAGSYPNWFQYVEALLDLPVTQTPTGTALYSPAPAHVAVPPDILSIHDYGAQADDGTNGGATDAAAFAVIEDTFVSHVAQVGAYLGQAQQSLPVWMGELGMMQHNSVSGLGDVAWGRTWTGMSAAWYGWTFDRLAENGVGAMAEFAFSTKWAASSAGTPEGDDQRSLLDNMDSDPTTPVLQYWTMTMLDQFFPPGSTILTPTVTSPASPPDGVIHVFAATPGSDVARVAVVNMPDPGGSSTLQGGAGNPQNVTVQYRFASTADAQAAATTALPTAFFFDNTLFTDTKVTSPTGVPQITFQPFGTTHPPTDNGVPGCPAASLLTPTVQGNVVTVTFTSPGYGLVLVDFPTSAGPATAPPAIVLDATSGDGQQGAVGAPLAAPFVVTVRDSRSGVVAGVPVTFQVTSGSGSLSAASAVTDASGQATTTLTVGAAGPIEVQASAVDLEPVLFGATGE